MKTKSHALFDVDGVVLDYPSGFTAWVEHKKGMERIEGVYGTVYNFSKWFTVPPCPMDNLILDFNETIYAGNLKPFSDVVKAMKQAYNDFGTTYTFVTKFGTEAMLKKSRINNVLQFVPREAIEDFVFVELTDSKREALSRWENTDTLFVEDCCANAIEANEMGIDARIISRSYNIEEAARKKLKRIDDGKALYDVLQSVS